MRPSSTPPLPTGYDVEARYFDSGVCEAKREELINSLYGLVRPAFEGQLALLRELALTLFKQQLAVGGGGGSPRGVFVEQAAR